MTSNRNLKSQWSHWENLHVNQWVSITECIDREESQPSPFDGMAMFGATRRKPDVDGMPLQIRAMSWPFLCVTNGTFRFSIDIRDVRLTTLHPTYVKAMCSRAYSGPREADQGAKHILGGMLAAMNEEPLPPDKKKRKEAACPICEGPLVMRGTATQPIKLCCDECGFRGDRGERGGV